MKCSKLLILCGMMLLCFPGCAAKSEQPETSAAAVPMTELTLPKQLTERELNTVPDISATDAAKTAEKAVPDRKFNKKPQLEITVDGDAAFLIWDFESDDGGTARIDAHTGEVLYAFDGEIED